jgi:hypothetical protein
MLRFRSSRTPAQRLVWITDTHGYSVEARTNAIIPLSSWIAVRAQERRYAGVVHTGDLMNTPNTTEAGYVTAALDTLDAAGLPVEYCLGNHDSAGYAHVNTVADAVFPASRKLALYDEFESGKSDNTCSIFTIGEVDWLILSLEFGARDEVLAWAQDVLDARPSLPVIAITHSYLYHDGTRMDWATKGSGQRYNPHAYFAEYEGTVNDGEEMWQTLFALNSQVKLVLSGHDLSGPDLYENTGVCAYKRDTRADGSICHQMVGNYQDTQFGVLGNHWITELGFDYASNRLTRDYYNPVTGVMLAANHLDAPLF